ncbi:MAG: electron transport complex subunit RsxC [Spirochaetes bacterium]|nr:electron transport complex subunit RsxC [Spirochaetota bacterium]
MAAFKGGIHPSPNKKLTSEKGFSNLSIPHIVNIPLKQHSGNPAIPVVKAGDSVYESQLIGKADGLISANIHSSVPGKVMEIADSGFIVIETDGRFPSSGKTQNKIPWQDFNKETLISRISAAGITCMNGDSFPAAVKLSLQKDQKVDCLIINCIESEPYLTTNDILIKTYPEEIIEGIRIVLKILGTGNAYIGIEKNKSHTIDALEKQIGKNSLKENIKIFPFKTKYPQGAEKPLIRSILKKEVPSGKLSIDIGIIVLDVSTVFAIREACVLNKPLFERFVTVTGKIINKPGNYKIRIGTRITDIIEECGGLKENPVKIIIGGPMCGTSVADLDTPVQKGTAGIIFLSKKDTAGLPQKNYGPCIRCGRCVTACPSRLIPTELGSAILNSQYNLALKMNIFDCIMCGSCSYVCPANRPISSIIKTAMGKMREQKSA